MSARRAGSPHADPVTGRVARWVAGAALGPALLGGGLLRLVGVLLLGVAIGALGAWLVLDARPAPCPRCSGSRWGRGGRMASGRM